MAAAPGPGACSPCGHGRQLPSAIDAAMTIPNRLMPIATAANRPPRQKEAEASQPPPIATTSLRIPAPTGQSTRTAPRDEQYNDMPKPKKTRQEERDEGKECGKDSRHRRG